MQKEVIEIIISTIMLPVLLSGSIRSVYTDQTVVNCFLNPKTFDENVIEILTNNKNIVLKTPFRRC